MNKNDIYVNYGINGKKMVMELLENANIAKEIDDTMKIGIKPNLVVASPSKNGATTTPDIVEGIIEYLITNNKKNIVIIEGSWVGDNTKRAFKVCGYEEISQKYNIPLVDTKGDTATSYDAGDNIILDVCNRVMELDYLINVPVLKGHCQTKMTCALKNMKGCIPDSEKRKYHSMGLTKPIAYLNKVLKQNLIVVDGLNGDLDFEEGGNPIQMDRILLGKDPVLMDSYVASLMGYSLEDVPYISLANRLCVGSMDIDNANIIKFGSTKTKEKLKPSRRAESLSKYIIENDACSACYGSLIHALDRLDSKGGLSKNLKVHIGQGFKGEKIDGIGIGTCTNCFTKSLKGCPPTGKAIIDFLS